MFKYEDRFIKFKFSRCRARHECLSSMFLCFLLDIQLVNTNERQYLIYNRNLTYLGAQENCKMWKADIVTYTNPVQYINLQRNITINGAYWVGGNALNELNSNF